MAKLKFEKWSNVGDVLTNEELKHVCGGMSNGTSAYCVSCVLKLENGIDMVIPCDSLQNQSNCNAGCISQCTQYNHTAKKWNKCASIDFEFYPC